MWSLTLIQISLWSGAYSLWYFRGRVKVTHSTAHYPLRPGAAGVFLSKCSAYWWIEIHVSQFRYDNPHYLAFSSHLFLPCDSFLSLSSLVLPHTFILTPSSPSVLYPMCHIALSPPHPVYLHLPHRLLFSPLSLSLSPMCLHHFFTSPSVLSEKPLELAAPEFWSATLWSKKPRQTAFPINQYFQWLWLTSVTSALHGGKCSVLEQNSKYLTYPGYSQILLIGKHFTYWADKFSEIRNTEVPLALSFRSLVHFEWVNKWVSEGVSECWFFFKKRTCGLFLYLLQLHGCHMDV